MSRPKDHKVHVTLTEPQYRALRNAAADRQDSAGSSARERRLLNRAVRALSDAWRGRE